MKQGNKIIYKIPPIMPKPYLENLKITSPKNVVNMTLKLGGRVISQTKPTKRGKINFWDNFYLNMYELQYCDVVIEAEVKDINVEHKTDFLKSDSEYKSSGDLPLVVKGKTKFEFFVPVFIQSQTFEVKECMQKHNLDPNKFNNILYIRDGTCALIYVNE